MVFIKIYVEENKIEVIEEDVLCRRMLREIFYVAGYTIYDKYPIIRPKNIYWKKINLIQLYGIML
jgi:hypothetical protein